MDREPLFVNRGTSDTDRVWQKMMVMLEGQDWRAVRSKFTPIFTSGKLKWMLEFLYASSANMIADIDGRAAKGDYMDLKRIAGKFSLDSIASCAFGVEAKAFSDADSPFVRNVLSVFSRSSKDAVKIMLSNIPGMVGLMRIFDISIFKPQETQFFRDTIAQVGFSSPQ